MRRILSLIAVVALMVAFALPVVTADAASHEKAQEAGKEMMKKDGSEKMMEKSDSEKMMKKEGEEGKKAMEEMKANPCDPKTANPGAMKKH